MRRISVLTVVSAAPRPSAQRHDETTMLRRVIMNAGCRGLSIGSKSNQGVFHVGYTTPLRSSSALIPLPEPFRTFFCGCVLFVARVKRAVSYVFPAEASYAAPSCTLSGLTFIHSRYIALLPVYVTSQRRLGRFSAFGPHKKHQVVGRAPHHSKC